MSVFELAIFFRLDFVDQEKKKKKRLKKIANIIRSVTARRLTVTVLV